MSFLQNSFFLLLLIASPLLAKPSCDKVLEKLFKEAVASGKARSSMKEIPLELRPLIRKIVKSGTRTREQHKALADALAEYLSKNGVKTRLENQYPGFDLVVESVSKDSPFTWAKNVPAKLSERFDYKMEGVFNTDTILNPYTPGFKGGSAQFRTYYSEKKGQLVYSAKSLMNQRFYASGDGHEAIHARTVSDSTPQIIIQPQSSKLDGKIGADLYGREFSSDEIHSAYPFSVRTSLRGIEPGKKTEKETSDALGEIKMTQVRNALLQGLFETAEPAYLEALKPGAITKKTIRDWGARNHDRSVQLQVGDESVTFSFQSEQVNRWKLEQDPKASKERDWSKDPKTVRAMIERDYLASKKATEESNWLVQNLTGEKPAFESYREATKKLQELREKGEL